MPIARSYDHTRRSLRSELATNVVDSTICTFITTLQIGFIMFLHGACLPIVIGLTNTGHSVMYTAPACCNMQTLELLNLRIFKTCKTY